MTEAVLAPFVAKLVEIFDTNNYSDFIQWNENQINITNPKEFAKTVIPSYFKLQKIESFMRQLNSYGFSRTSNSKRLSFRHQNFQRGDIDKLKLIQLKQKSKQVKQSSSDNRLSEKSSKLIMDKVLQKNKEAFQKCLSSLFSKVSEFAKSNPGSQNDFARSLSLLKFSMMNDTECSGSKSPISDYSNKTACDQ